MQFILEIGTLFLIFLLFRQAVVKAFPVHAVGLSLSEDSKAALRKYRRRYLVLFWTSGITLTLLFTIGLYELFFQLHSSGVEGQVLIIERTALLLPSAVLGFLTGTFLSRWINSKMQADGLSFFFEEYHDEWKGFDTTKVRSWHIAGSLLIAGTILFTQYQIFAIVNDDQIVWQTTPWELSQNSTEDIESITPEPDNEFSIVFSSGDTLFTGRMGGNKVSFVNGIKKPRQKTGL
ncbi:MAG: hypothetical protein ACPF9D_05380 [Owenweeksia sp.]